MKTRFFLSFILALSTVLCALSSLEAQVPQGFNYQAIARDVSGNPLTNQSLPVRLTIQSDSLGGTILWQELHSSVTTNSFGLLTVIVGKGARQAPSTVATFPDIDWKVTPKFIKTEIYYNSQWNDMGSSRLWSVPYSMTAGNLSGPVEKLAVSGQTPLLDEALFEVKNNTGQTVFAVYNEGVRIYVDDGAKGIKGGFAIGGFGNAKKPSQEYFRVTQDSTRVYVNQNISKAIKGGFAIGGFNPEGKVPVVNYLNLTPNNYLIGHESGKNMTSGLYNVFLGYQSGYSNSSGNYNLFLGFQSGYFNTAGYNNAFFGYQTGLFNTTGYSNVFIGNNSGTYNNEGFYNTFIGNYAGYSNTTGFMNIFIGNEAGTQNTTANRNVFIGPLAGRNNTTGEANVFIGQQAGEANTTGSFNFFAGRAAGNFNTTGIMNTFLGINAGNVNTTGRENVALGGESAKWNSTGSYNVNLGSCAGFSNTNGDLNVMIGYYSGISLTSGSNNIFIGPYSGGGLTNADSKLFIENSSADMNNALIYGDFSTDYLKLNANVDIRNKLNFNNYGQVLYVNNSEALYYNGTAFSWGFGGTYNVFADPVSVGTTGSPGSYALYVAGNAFTTGTWGSSDIRLKKDIKPLGNIITKLTKLQGITYKWRVDEYPDMKFDDKAQIGLIAQEVEKVLPELVKTDDKGYKAISYEKLSVLLLEAVKEQQRQIESLIIRLSEIESNMKNK
ncbi:MAG: tail fiber domain-containing protein [Bacteroidales bacterium]